MPTDEENAGQKGPLTSRLAWFAGLWLAGLLVTAGVAYGLRALLFTG